MSSVIQKEYALLENHIKRIFETQGSFHWEGKRFHVREVDKPRPRSGECKTDCYVLGECEGKELELKISIKLKGKDEFQGNKLQPTTAESYFGVDWQNIIRQATMNAKEVIESQPVIFLKKRVKTQPDSYTMGWKLEIASKQRDLSVPIPLEDQQIRDYIYKGTKLPQHQKDSYVNKEIKENSGVADYIIYTTRDQITCTDDVIRQMQYIDDAKLEPTYLIFTANNYRPRSLKDPTDGKRYLCVKVNWFMKEGKLAHNYDYSNPLYLTGKYDVLPSLSKLLNHFPTIHPTEMNIQDCIYNPSYVHGYNDFWEPEKSLFEETNSLTELEQAIALNKNTVGRRGDFKFPPDYTKEEVKQSLIEKINEERETVIEANSDFCDEQLHHHPDKFNVLSLFCGAGGLDLGFELAGLEAMIGSERALNAFKDKETFNTIRHESIFHTVYSNDMFTEALESYRENMPNHIYIHQKDIRKVKEFPKANIVLGGFPCPGFSEAGPRLVDDERNFLYIHFIRCLMQVQPEVFVAENVKGMMTLGRGEVFKQIVEDFAAAGYNVQAKLLNVRDYGVPQIRERVIIVGVRNDLDFDYVYPKPMHGEIGSDLKPFVTLEEAIGDLRGNPGPYFTGSYSTIFMSRDRKKNWNEQSFTIQASGRQAPIHPGGLPMEKLEANKWIFPDGEENNRRLSVKEIARIQTFPDWYYFSQGNNMKMSENGRLDKAYKQIGNAVPVFLARAVAKPIAEWAVQYIREGNHHDSQLRFLL
ncbi:DNA cytosine methyltransferase [Priestia megaterium]|uniref:DNA cytosine methyltransferase n=1 Tax=Priestia megaterium TaxID=1404 RepID=UPI001CB8DB83|nr:DNA cytosine methyltransferase [Priestia megaterium]